METYEKIAMQLSGVVNAMNELINENKRLKEEHEPKLDNNNMINDLAIDNTIVNAQRIAVLEKEIDLLKAKLKVVEDELENLQQRVREWDIPYCDDIPSCCDPMFYQEDKNQTSTYGVKHPIYSESTSTIK